MMADVTVSRDAAAPAELAWAPLTTWCACRSSPPETSVSNGGDLASWKPVQWATRGLK
jgi:hypothetical protein